MQKVRAFAPATVANLGVGFDVIGLAVADVGDFVTAERHDTPGVEVVSIVGDDGRLPRSSQKNTAAIAAARVLDLLQINAGVQLSIEKGLPPASGLGSSAASAVAAAVATNVLFGELLTPEDLLPAVLDAEEAVSGRHADNVAPALFGGIVLVTGLLPSEIHRLPVPPGLYLALTTPQVEVPTQEARAVLPKVVPLSVLVHQTGVIAELVHALHMGNIHLLASAVQRDAVVEPAREALIPYLAEVRHAARRAGALATVISGSGPTTCSICISIEDALSVQEVIQQLYAKRAIGCLGVVTTPAEEGARVIQAMPG
ncbi:MAG: homoserine kinase [Anaerolineae bacterium]|nr:homoserine kinase [Anaerolineae bacterium]